MSRDSINFHSITLFYNLYLLIADKVHMNGTHKLKKATFETFFIFQYFIHFPQHVCEWINKRKQPNDTPNRLINNIEIFKLSCLLGSFCISQGSNLNTLKVHAARCDYYFNNGNYLKGFFSTRMESNAIL